MHAHPTKLYADDMPSNKNTLKVVTVMAVAVLVMVARFFIISPSTAKRLIEAYGYWAIAATFAGFAVLVAKQLPAKEGILKLVKTHRASLICILLAGVYFPSPRAAPIQGAL